MLSWVAIKLVLGGIAGKLWKWLTSLSFWQIVSLALGILVILQRYELAHERKNAAAYQKQALVLKAELQKISTAKNEQKIITQTRIETVTKTIHDADVRAKIVEQAPPAPNCKTKLEVMNADV